MSKYTSYLVFCQINQTYIRPVYWDFLYLGFMARQDYFTHFELIQSLVGAKTGDAREKTPEHPQSQRACPTCARARLEPTAI